MSTRQGGESDRKDSQADSANKRAALAGQWRTPPMPVYPGYGPYSSQPAPSPASQSHDVSPPPAQQNSATLGIPSPTNIPSNSEDYAKALQEAYRKGAEAAARMAQQQMPTAASCPNFSTGPQVAPPPPSRMGEATEEAAYSHQVHPTHTSNYSAPDPLASNSMPPPPPPQHHPHLHHSHANPSPHTAMQHQPTPPPPPPHQQHYSAAAPFSHPPEDYSPPPQPPPSTTAKAAQGRSLSMPDMSTYAAQAEEEKRQKRLARNRASARLRRLRKKNLVRI